MGQRIEDGCDCTHSKLRHRRTDRTLQNITLEMVTGQKQIDFSVR